MYRDDIGEPFYPTCIDCGIKQENRRIIMYRMDGEYHCRNCMKEKYPKYLEIERIIEKKEEDKILPYPEPFSGNLEAEQSEVLN